MQALSQTIREFDPTLPIERASTPPASWYTGLSVYEAELRTVFVRNWLVAARADQVDAPRKYTAGEVAGERYLVVRGEDESLRAFFNVCRHHAAAVVSGDGRARRFSCPYHGWTYGLDGRLLNAPEIGDIEDFDPGCFGLVPMAVGAWGPFVFISMQEKGRPLADDLAVLKNELDEMRLDSLRFVKRVCYTLECNWKVYVDNYLDGGYHVAYLHRGLAAQLDLESYGTRIFERYSILGGAGAAAKRAPQVAGKKVASQGKDFAERIGGRVLYAWIYPNLMINRYGTMMDTNWVIPLGPERTEVIFDYYFIDVEGPEAQQLIDRSIAASDVVQLEDMGICEAVQKGLRSRSYDRGRYSVIREKPMYHFHRLLAEDLRVVAQGNGSDPPDPMRES